jgi:hypothetical protein
MGHDLEAWYKYHRIRGHSTDNCWKLRKEIEKLIQEIKLKGYVKRERGEDQRRPLRKREKRVTGKTQKSVTPLKPSLEASLEATNPAHLVRNMSDR